MATGALLVLAGLGLLVWVVAVGEDPSPTVEPDRSDEHATPPTTEVTTTTTSVLAGHELHEAACRVGLRPEISDPVDHPLLVEVSGIAMSGSTAWVHNDSGDEPRIYGISPEGTVQVVELVAAEAVDWEDITVQRGATPAEDVLWVGDIGGNIAPRASVQIYRVPVPEPGATAAENERWDVTIPDRHRDFESLMVEPDGSLLLASKEAGRSHLYRVVPRPGGGPVEADALGSFAVGDGEVSELTSADLASDGSAVLLRTYGSVFTVPVRTGEEVIDALADTGRRCRGFPPVEIQGEAVGFLPDDSGYVSMGETRNPVLTTVRTSR